MIITHLIYSFTTGGAETMLVDIANEQVKYKDVNIVIINSRYNTQLIDKIDKSVGVYFIGRKEGGKNPLPLIKLNLLLLRLKSNVIHCHNDNIIPLLLNKFRKISVLTLHCLGISSKYLNKYEQLISISEAVRSDILNNHNISTSVVSNGIRVELIKIKTHTCKPNALFKIICVGRLDNEIKGQNIAVEALKILKDKKIIVHLDLIGEGSSRKFLEELIVKYKLDSQVNLLGHRDRDFIYKHLNSYDLLIQPSLHEGFGLTVTEGMAARIPVLVSNVDGPMEIIDNGKYGYYFKSGSAEDLANKIEDIYKLSNEAINVMTSKAYTRAVNSFDIRKTANAYLKLYIEKKSNE
jgi:glycosyltransferase involved in cell wall biosynthesis